MSQYADLLDIFRSCHEDGKLTKSESVELFLEVLGALEWNIDEEIDYDKPDWHKFEFKQAMKVLFD